MDRVSNSLGLVSVIGGLGACPQVYLELVIDEESYAYEGGARERGVG